MSTISRLWERRTESPVFVAVTVLTVATLVVWPVVDFYLRGIELVIPYRFNDFGAYVGALERWGEGGAIYVRDDAGGYHGSYLYPPLTLLAFYPFTTFAFPTGATLLGVTSLVLLWVGLEATTETLGYELGVGDRLVAGLALVGFYPALRGFKWGQIPALLAALLCFAFYAQELAVRRQRGRYDYLSGALTTVASAFKLFFATSGAHLLRDRKRFLGAMVTAGLLLVASLAVFGIDVHRTYLDVLMWGKGWGDTTPLYLWDSSAAYHPLHVLGPLGMPVRLLGIVAVIGLSLVARPVRTAGARWTTFALGVAVVPLLAPSADTHDLVVLLLPAAILLAVELERDGGYPTLPVAAVLLLHLHRFGLEFALNPPDWLPLAGFVRQQAAWFQPGMWATLVLVGLAAVRVAEHTGRRSAPAEHGLGA